MKINTGVDIIEIKRIRRLTANAKFMNRIFSSEEREYFEKRKNNPSTVAGFFCAKEAVSKCLGTGINGFSWKDIYIYVNDYGKPQVELRGKAKENAKKKNINEIEISISHSKENAVCVAFSLTSEEKEYPAIPFSINKRKPDTHKGNYGKVAVIGGSAGMTGALYFSCNAAMRSGSGLVFAFAPESLKDSLEIKFSEVITKYFDDADRGYLSYENYDAVIEELWDKDILCLGPGMGKDEGRIGLTEKILENYKKPVILDADGINCIAGHKDILKRREGGTIIKPHPGEMSGLINKSTEWINNNREKAAADFSEKYNVITVLKGNKTVVASPEGKIYVNNTGNPGMATAGSGDVLSGIISSFSGQNFGLYESAVNGVFIHGFAGDLAACDFGEYGMTASDVIAKIPAAIKIYEDKIK